MLINAKYAARVTAINSMLCVGLDSHLESIPAQFRHDPHPQFAFNRWIIEQTHPYTAAYKPNIAFYEARGAEGLRECAMTIAYLREHHPDILTICDAKRGDNANSNLGYVTAIYDEMGFDSVTLHPYMGSEALKPFLNRADKAAIIVCRTSNSGAGELQDLDVGGRPLWERIAERVRDEWNTKGNCMLVIGATYPDELRRAREICPNMIFLVPGIGAQGGTVQEVIDAGSDTSGQGLIISASRSVIFAENPAEEARKLRDQMQRVF